MADDTMALKKYLENKWADGKNPTYADIARRMWRDHIELCNMQTIHDRVRKWRTVKVVKTGKAKSNWVLSPA